jgi:hypothetical protein
MYDHNPRDLCDLYCITDEKWNTACNYFHKTGKSCVFCRLRDFIITEEGQAGCEERVFFLQIDEC